MNTTETIILIAKMKSRTTDIIEIITTLIVMTVIEVTIDTEVAVKTVHKTIIMNQFLEINFQTAHKTYINLDPDMIVSKEDPNLDFPIDDRTKAIQATDITPGKRFRS